WPPTPPIPCRSPGPPPGLPPRSGAGAWSSEGPENGGGPEPSGGGLGADTGLHRRWTGSTRRGRRRRSRRPGRQPGSARGLLVDLDVEVHVAALDRGRGDGDPEGLAARGEFAADGGADLRRKVLRAGEVVGRLADLLLQDRGGLLRDLVGGDAGGVPARPGSIAAALGGGPVRLGGAALPAAGAAVLRRPGITDAGVERAAGGEEQRQHPEPDARGHPVPISGSHSIPPAFVRWWDSSA